MFKATANLLLKILFIDFQLFVLTYGDSIENTIQATTVKYDISAIPHLSQIC